MTGQIISLQALAQRLGTPAFRNLHASMPRSRTPLLGDVSPGSNPPNLSQFIPERVAAGRSGNSWDGLSSTWVKDWS